MTTSDTTPETRVQVRVDKPTAAWLADRADRMHTGSHHLQAKQELDLWRAVMAAELRRVRFSLREATCLADVLHGSALDATIMGGGVGIVYAEVFDAFRLARETPLAGEPTYADKWGIDEESLLNRLGKLGPAGDHALRDALSRWGATGGDTTVEGFTAVGMVVVDDEDHA